MGSAARHSTSGRRSTGHGRLGRARCLKALEDENSRLKKLLAETMLDNAILKGIAAKKW
jgi:putative transposase